MPEFLLSEDRITRDYRRFLVAFFLVPFFFAAFFFFAIIGHLLPVFVFASVCLQNAIYFSV